MPPKRCLSLIHGMSQRHQTSKHLVDALEVLVRLAVEHEDDVAGLYVRLIAPRLTPQCDLRLVLHALLNTDWVSGLVPRQNGTWVGGVNPGSANKA